MSYRVNKSIHTTSVCSNCIYDILEICLERSARLVYCENRKHIRGVRKIVEKVPRGTIKHYEYEDGTRCSI
jgi:hypothetical protein